MNAAKTQLDDNKKGIAAAATKTEESKSSDEVFKVVRQRWQMYRRVLPPLPSPPLSSPLKKILAISTHTLPCFSTLGFSGD